MYATRSTRKTKFYDEMSTGDDESMSSSSSSSSSSSFSSFEQRRRIAKSKRANSRALIDSTNNSLANGLKNLQKLQNCVDLHGGDLFYDTKRLLSQYASTVGVLEQHIATQKALANPDLLQLEHQSMQVYAKVGRSRNCACGLSNHNRKEHAGQQRHMKFLFGILALQNGSSQSLEAWWCTCSPQAGAKAAAQPATNQKPTHSVPLKPEQHVKVTMSTWEKSVLPASVQLHGLACVRCGALANVHQHEIEDPHKQTMRLISHLAQNGFLKAPKHQALKKLLQIDNDHQDDDDFSVPMQEDSSVRPVTRRQKKQSSVEPVQKEPIQKEQVQQEQEVFVAGSTSNANDLFSGTSPWPFEEIEQDTQWSMFDTNNDDPFLSASPFLSDDDHNREPLRLSGRVRRRDDWLLDGPDEFLDERALDEEDDDEDLDEDDVDKELRTRLSNLSYTDSSSAVSGQPAAKRPRLTVA